MTFDGKAFGEEIAGFVRDYVDRATGEIKSENEALKARIVALEARPAPEKGEKGETGQNGKDGADGRDGAPGADGRDGVGVVDVVKDSGELCFTLADGRLIRTGIRDGEKGADGRDGIDLDSFEAIVLEDDRTIELKFVSGNTERVASFKWPTTIYRSVYKDGEQYEPGDMVTWGGSLWHCDKQTTAKPGTEDWTLAAKKGRDGKDAKNG